MIRNFVARFTVLALPLAACTSEPADTPQSAEVALADAKARAQDLANSTQNYQPVRFVSAIEQVRPPRPVLQPRVEEVVKPGTDSVHVEPIPVPAPVVEAAEPETPVDSAPPPSAPRVPSVIPRKASLPEAVGAGTTYGAATGDWRGADPGPDMGTVIGVVLRGGRGDPGHCPRHRPPSQIPSRIPQ